MDITAYLLSPIQELAQGRTVGDETFQPLELHPIFLWAAAIALLFTIRLFGATSFAFLGTVLTLALVEDAAGDSELDLEKKLSANAAPPVTISTRSTLRYLRTATRSRLSPWRGALSAGVTAAFFVITLARDYLLPPRSFSILGYILATVLSTPFAIVHIQTVISKPTSDYLPQRLLSLRRASLPTLFKAHVLRSFFILLSFIFATSAAASITPKPAIYQNGISLSEARQELYAMLSTAIASAAVFLIALDIALLLFVLPAHAYFVRLCAIHLPEQYEYILPPGSCIRRDFEGKIGWKGLVRRRVVVLLARTAVLVVVMGIALVAVLAFLALKGVGGEESLKEMVERKAKMRVAGSGGGVGS